MESLISSRLRDGIYEKLKLIVSDTKYDHEFMNLLSSLWDVYNKPRIADERFSNLGDEIEKHFVMNDDWSDDKLFISILHIKNDDDKLIRLFEGLLNVSTQSKELAENILQTLKSDEFNIIDSDGKWIVHIGNMDTPIIEDRSKPFYVCKSRIVNAVAFREEDVVWPLQTDCFVLTFNYVWNDFSLRTCYKLYYVSADGKHHKLGIVKIMHEGKDDTRTVLPSKFWSLPSEYCSLGEDVSYYQNMRELFGNNAYIYLSELCDAALYSRVYEKFEHDSIFKVSLCRYNSSDKALREGRYHIYGRDMSKAFSFSLHFRTEYMDKENEEEQVEISFPFYYECPAYKRIFGLIGENGTGKTTLINEIIKGLISKDAKIFLGPKPLFAKVLVNSYSPFDHFPPVQNDYTIDYSYCGIVRKENELYSLTEQIDRWEKDVRKICERGNADAIWNQWIGLAKDVIPNELLRKLRDKDGKIDEEVLKDIRKFCSKMSSGESIFLFSISSIMARIRPNTLLLFDEPEQHLHPQAITRLFNAISVILDKYESYAIVATHSALVIRELVSENVYIFNRAGNSLLVSKIGIETFGEDISVLNNYVFKNLNEHKRFEYYIGKIANEQNFDYEKIISALNDGENEPSLSLKLYIMNILKQHERYNSK